MAYGDEVLEMIKHAREQEPERRTLCPDCDYELSETKEGILHCEFCGWNEEIKRGK